MGPFLKANATIAFASLARLSFMIQKYMMERNDVKSFTERRDRHIDFISTAISLLHEHQISYTHMIRSVYMWNIAPVQYDVSYANLADHYGLYLFAATSEPLKYLHGHNTIFYIGSGNLKRISDHLGENPKQRVDEWIRDFVKRGIEIEVAYVELNYPVNVLRTLEGDLIEEFENIYGLHEETGFSPATNERVPSEDLRIPGRPHLGNIIAHYGC